MFHGCGESIGGLPLPEQAGRRPGGLHQQRAVGRVPRLRARPGDLRRRVARWTSWPASWASTRSSCRRRNVVVPGRPRSSTRDERRRPEFGSYGLDQCLDLVAGRAGARRRRPAPEGAHWRVGEGMALAMIATIPPRGHFADAYRGADADGDVHAARRHRRVRQRHHDRAHADRRGACSAPTPDRHRDPAVRHRRGGATTPARSARRARGRRPRGHGRPSLRDDARVAAGRRRAGAMPADGARSATARCGSSSSDAAALGRRQLERGATATTVAALGGVQRAGLPGRGRHRAPARCGSCSRCRPPTPASVMNPEQCRGQVEGGVAQAIGAALYEEI